MSVVNNCTFIGNLVKDPEMKETPSGVHVTNFTIAVRRSFVKEGQQDSDFISMVAWSKTAEFISKYFKKGNKIRVRGSMESRNWTDKEGAKHYITECRVDEATFVESKKKDDAGTDAPSGSEDDLPF